MASGTSDVYRIATFLISYPRWHIASFGKVLGFCKKQKTKNKKIGKKI